MQQFSEEIETIAQSVRRRCAAACQTCKRRKERCDGVHPCGRCTDRGVSDHCHFIERPKHKSRRARHNAHRDLIDNQNVMRRRQLNATSQSEASPTGSLTTNNPLPSGLDSRLLQDQRGRYMFIGDSANLSFLQVLRRVVGECIGSCSFVDDPLRSLMVEASPEGQPEWLNAGSQRKAHRPLPSNAYR